MSMCRDILPGQIDHLQVIMAGYDIYHHTSMNLRTSSLGQEGLWISLSARQEAATPSHASMAPCSLSSGQEGL